MTKNKLLDCSLILVSLIHVGIMVFMLWTWSHAL